MSFSIPNDYNFQFTNLWTKAQIEAAPTLSIIQINKTARPYNLNLIAIPTTIPILPVNQIVVGDGAGSLLSTLSQSTATNGGTLITNNISSLTATQINMYSAIQGGFRFLAPNGSAQWISSANTYIASARAIVHGVYNASGEDRPLIAGHAADYTAYAPLWLNATSLAIAPVIVGDATYIQSQITRPNKLYVGGSIESNSIIQANTNLIVGTIGASNAMQTIATANRTAVFPDINGRIAMTIQSGFSTSFAPTLTINGASGEVVKASLIDPGRTATGAVFQYIVLVDIVDSGATTSTAFIRNAGGVLMATLTGITGGVNQKLVIPIVLPNTFGIDTFVLSWQNGASHVTNIRAFLIQY